MNAVVFSGQGVQYEGMGKDLYENFTEAKRIFLLIDKILGINISRICFYEEQELNQLYNQQLGVIAVSLAAYELFKISGIKVDYFSGLSLGEYSCLYPSGTLNLEDTVNFVKVRAEATIEAARKNPSSMLAVIGLKENQIKSIGEKEGFYVANINSSKQMVVSVKEEDKENIKNVLKNNKYNSRIKIREIDTGAGFHSPFMEPARIILDKYADNLRFSKAHIPIVNNIMAKEAVDGNEIKKCLVDQLTHTVLWEKCVEYMVYKGVNTFFVVGPAKVLGRLIKQISPDVKVIGLEKKEDFDKLYDLDV